MSKSLHEMNLIYIFAGSSSWLEAWGSGDQDPSSDRSSQGCDLLSWDFRNRASFDVAPSTQDPGQGFQGIISGHQR